MADYTTIETLWKKTKSKNEIARITGHNWRTVNKVIKKIEEGKGFPDKKPHPRKLDKYKDSILQYLEQNLSGVRIHEKLLERGVAIKYSTVKSFIAHIKRNDIFVRIHTKPGEEAQVDFGYAGYTLDNNKKRRKTWVFNMRLSYSRYDYFEAVYDQKVETFIQCHINAFNFFGGIPEFVKIDNLKAAILHANFYEPVYQKLYKQFAQHYGFNPIPCRIYSPNDKGKVESGIKYVKTNFFAGRKFDNKDDLQKKLKDWIDKKCNCRVHGTTRKVPKEIFTTFEKPKLLALPTDDFKFLDVGTRKVYHDCHIFVDYNYYSVPYKYVGKDVEIELSKKLLKIFYNYQEIACHPRVSGKGEFSTINEHYPKYKIISTTEYQEKYQAKMSKIGGFAELIFLLILQKNPNYWQRTVKGIVSLTKIYSAEIVNLSCKRALSYNVHSYQIIKNICKNGSYNLPIEFQEVNYELYKN